MASSAMPTRDDFAALLDKSLGESQSFEGKVVKGRVTAIENDLVVIDVGLKSEGRISIREFTPPGPGPAGVCRRRGGRVCRPRRERLW